MLRKTIFQRLFTIFGMAALTGLLLACSDEMNIQKQQDKPTVSFSVTDSTARHDAARTVFPQVDLDNVAWYQLRGGKDYAAESVLVESFTGTGTSVPLDTGMWNFTLDAYNGWGERILQGTVQNRQISQTGANNVSFSLSGINNGTGAIEITINVPISADITRIAVDGDVMREELFSDYYGNFIYTQNYITAGDYFINFELYSGNVLRTVIGEQVLVRGNLTSSKTITLAGEDLKPLLTGTVSIAGIVLVGEILTADTGALDGTGDIFWQWNLNGVAIAGADNSAYTVQDADIGASITVTVRRAGYAGTVTSTPVVVPALTYVTFNGLTNDGSATQTTTVLTLTLSESIAGLSRDDITITTDGAIIKGVLSGSGPVYTLPITGFSGSGTLSVSVAKSGYNIIGSPMPVEVYLNSAPEGMVWIPAGTFTMGSYDYRYTICTGMYMSGAGTGTGIIRTVTRATHRERFPVRTAWYAAGRGTAAVSTRVRPIGAATTRTTGTATTVSGWCVPEKKEGVNHHRENTR